MDGRRIIRPCPCGSYGEPTHVVTDDDQEWHPACAIREVYRLRLAIEAHREAVGVPHDVYDRDAELYAALERP